MLSFHKPESLYSEMILITTAGMVFLYRFISGRDDWVATHGVILATYYAVGGIVYDELEDWKLLDTTYFLTVTITTVGYGDICPQTDIGKLFTVVYSLIGIVFVFAALSPLVDALKAVNSFILSPCAPIEKNDYDSLEELKLNGNWGFKYSKAGMGLFLTFSIGLLIGFFVMQLSLVNCVYWSMITMTTIGYGDISGHSAIERLFLIVYLPLAVAALADTLGVVSKIGTARDLIETDFAKRADELLLGEAGGEDPNPDETLTEAELLISVLKDKSLVDDLTVNAIRLQFAHITRHDTSNSDNKVLDDRMVFYEMLSQGRIAQSGPRAPKTTPDGLKVETVDLAAADGGFQEWLETYWWPRVFDGKDYGGHQVRLQKMATPRDAKGNIKGDPKANPNAYKRLAEEKLATKAKATGGSHRSPRLLGPNDEEAPKAIKGYFMAGQMAVADGEYVWMPREQAKAARASAAIDDRDLGLWVLLALFVVYFCVKAVPDIWAYHMGEEAEEEADRLLRRLAELRSGDEIAGLANAAAALLAHRR